jgi:phosphatidylserine/phosphatidylglycerophosphate/cardiolipin synthase-like enzyme
VAGLVARGANVSFLASDPQFPARYATMHAKLVVVDREAVLVGTENFHAGSYPAAPGSDGTRGFGVVVRNASLARAYAGVLDADLAPWPDVRAADLDALPPPAELAARATPAGPVLAIAGSWNVTPIVSPDASFALVDALGAARSRIDVAMLFADARFGSGPDPFLDALVAAARRSVSVRILLDASVDEGRNRAVVERLTALAAREGLPLAARLDTWPRTLHAKTVLIDGRVAYVGSMNWGLASATHNREAGLLLESNEAAAWLGDVYDREWAGPPAPERHVGGAGVALTLVAITWSALRRSRW